MTQELDTLNREKVINTIGEIILLLSKSKQGKVFAVDGGWGYGKTYILERLEKELEIVVNEETTDDRYYVFHYNCWQYDYYDEPAIAIISAMLDKFNKEVDESITGVAKDTWAYAKDIMSDIAGEFIKNKIGIDLVDVYKGIKTKGKKRKKDTYEFDKMFAFKRTLDMTRKKISELAQRKTVLLVVDELDRCMPQYAIKVLERLHHLFYGIENVVVVLGIDSSQLEHSIKEIYGSSTDTEKYLRKFINFTIKIDLGQIQENVAQKHKSFFSQFSDINEVMPYILRLSELCQIDIRNYEKIIEKIELIHRMVCTQQVPCSILLFEMIWGVMKYKTLSAPEKTGKSFYSNLYWIPEIDKASYGGLAGCIGKETVEFLKEMKTKVTTNTVINGMNAALSVVKDDALGITWYLLDVVFAKKRTFCINREADYNEMIELCRMFEQTGSIMW